MTNCSNNTLYIKYQVEYTIQFDKGESQIQRNGLTLILLLWEIIVISLFYFEDVYVTDNLIFV